MTMAQHQAAQSMQERIKLLMKLRAAGITDTKVLSAIEQVPREKFVTEAFKTRAYEDTALPIAQGQTISQPSMVAWMTWALEVSDRMKVLEIGTGTGYQTAILSKLARRVYTIERFPDLLKDAEKRFQELGLSNITAMAGDGSKGWKATAPFDRIMVTAAAKSVPGALLEQLAEGGIMIAPVGGEGTEQLLLRIRKENGEFITQHLMSVRFVPLVEDQKP